MLFKSLKPFFVAASLASSFGSVQGAPPEKQVLDSCSKQQQCFEVAVTEQPTKGCKTTCDYLICLALDTAPTTCPKTGAISHYCSKPLGEESCSAGLGWGKVEDPSQTSSFSACQTVGNGQTAQFILKDGFQCADSVLSASFPGGATGSCSKTTEEYCSGSGNIGKECLWTITAPSTCTTAPTPVVTPTAPTPVVTPTAPTPVVTPTAPTPVVTPTAPTPVVTPTAPTPVVPGCQVGSVAQDDYCPCANSGYNGYCNDLCTEKGDYPKYSKPRGYCGCFDFRDNDDCDGDGIPDCIDDSVTCDNTPTAPTPVVTPTAPTPVVTPTAPTPIVTPTAPTPVVTPTAPTPVVTPTSGAQGDPHFKTWAGEKYDFHGACDLVLVQTPGFVGGLGMNVHIRTTRMEGVFSYISAAAVAIGEDTLEVGGDSENMMYWVNGVKGEELTEDSLLPNTLAGYPVKFRSIDDENKDFIINLGQNGTVAITTWNGYVGVDIYDATEENFGSSVGLLGNYKGSKVGRDGQIISDINEFGQEWQVLQSERKLFHSVVGPQHPEKCLIPSAAAQAHRRLSQSNVDQDAAELACAAVSDENRESCIFDVMATGNLKMARAYK